VDVVVSVSGVGVQGLEAALVEGQHRVRARAWNRATKSSSQPTNLKLTPMMASYNASFVKNYNAAGSLARFINKMY
jgi:hypothetical protein